jgi:VCBS repeat-containing protein
VNGDTPVQNEPEEEMPEEQPEEEPEEEPEESEPQQSEATYLGSGSLRSDTGVYLNLIAAWSAEAADSNTVNLKVDVLVESYALRAGAAYGALKLTVDGSTVVLDMPAINVEGQSLAQTHVVSRTFTVNVAKGQSANVAIEAEWFFGGQYSGAQLDTILCSGTAYLAR